MEVTYSYITFDERSNYILSAATSELQNYIWAGGYSAGPITNRDQFFTLSNFDIYNGFDQSNYLVLVDIFHQ